MAQPEPPVRTLNITAGIAAWLFPGAGHYFIHKDRTRGLAIGGGLLFLLICGLLIGGIDSVDRVQDKYWFLAQMPLGPLVLFIDWLNQAWLKQQPLEVLHQSVAIARPNEMGTLFIALAGLMNLVVIIDATHYLNRPAVDRAAPHRRRRRSDDAGDAGQRSAADTSPPRQSTMSPEGGGG